MEQTTLSKYVKAMRKQYNLTQVELSEKSGVGLRLVRELEQGKQTLRPYPVGSPLTLSCLVSSPLSCLVSFPLSC